MCLRFAQVCHLLCLRLALDHKTGCFEVDHENRLFWGNSLQAPSVTASTVASCCAASFSIFVHTKVLNIMLLNIMLLTLCNLLCLQIVLDHEDGPFWSSSSLEASSASDSAVVSCWAVSFFTFLYVELFDLALTISGLCLSTSKGEAIPCRTRQAQS